MVLVLPFGILFLKQKGTHKHPYRLSVSVTAKQHKIPCAVFIFLRSI